MGLLSTITTLLHGYLHEKLEVADGRKEEVGKHFSHFLQEKRKNPQVWCPLTKNK